MRPFLQPTDSPARATIYQFLDGPRRILQFRDFRVLWPATMAMSMGFWMQQLTLGWLVLQMSDSAFWVGAAEAARLAPFLLFGLVAGTIADRLERRILLRVIVTCNIVLSVALGILELNGLLSVPIAIGGAFLYGTVNAFLMPTLQAYVHDIVGSRLVVNGLALNQFAQRLMGVFGGLLGGVLLAVLGIGGTFLVMAGGYTIAFVILLFTRTASRPGFGAPEQPSVRQSFGEALSLVGRNPSVRALLLLSVATEIFAFSHIVMISIFARDVLEIGEQGFGIMVAARAVGSVVGVVALAAIGDRLPKGKTLLVASALFGLSLAAFGSQPWIITALVFLGLAGTMAAIFDTLQQAALQLAVGSDQRGRAMGIWVMGVGAGPVGHLEVGSLSDFTSPQFAVIFNGLMLVIFVILITMTTPRLRRI